MIAMDGSTEVRPVCCCCDQEITKDHCYVTDETMYGCICQSCIQAAHDALPDNFIRDDFDEYWYERYHKTPRFWI